MSKIHNKKIIAKESDYIISLKENQKELYEDILDSFRALPAVDTFEELDFGHGRIETRKCSILNDLSLVFGKDNWKGLTSIIKIERVREFKATGKIQREASHYISSLNQAKEIGLRVRKHWGIENKVHWALDVAFNEDLSRKRAGNAEENYSKINRVALNLLKKGDAKIGIKAKRKMTGWYNDYLRKVMSN